MKNSLNSISLAHYSVWTGEDFENVIESIEKLHFATKDAIVEWYKENPSLNYLALKYHEKFTPKSKIIKSENIKILDQSIEWLVESLKRSRFI